MFLNCKRKYLGKIMKIGYGRNLRKECENHKFCESFSPYKFIHLRYALLALAPRE